MGGKIEANKSTGGIKIIALGEELRVDPRQIVAAAKEMAMENAKVPASWVTAGQADRLRAKFGGQGELKAKIERKLRHFESALETPVAEPKVETIKTHSVKLGKRTFEADRRSIFGVVAKPAATVAPSHVPAEQNQSVAAVPVEAAKETAPVAPPTTPSSLAVPLPPPKKFIQVTVAPPIRRETGTADPRFGVIVPSPEVEKKEASTAIWNNLNDGHTPVNFSKPVVEDAAKSVPVDVPVEVEEIEEIKPEPVAVVEEPKQDSAKPSTHKARVEPAPVAPPALAHAPHKASRSHEHETPARKLTMDVPVKWEPKNKAFGSKVKHKTKVLKKLEALGVIGKDVEKKKPTPKKPESKPHAKHAPEPAKHETKKASDRKAEHGHDKKEGVLKRLIRKIFK